MDHSSNNCCRRHLSLAGNQHLDTTSSTMEDGVARCPYPLALEDPGLMLEILGDRSQFREGRDNDQQDHEESRMWQ